MPIYGETKEINPGIVVTLDAYTANDVVGGLLTFNVTSAGGGGVIRRLVLVDDANQSEPFNLYLFNALPSTIANDAAFAPTVADLQKMIGVVAIAAGDYTSLNSNAIAFKENIDIDYSVAGDDLFGYLVCTATPDYAAVTDLDIRLVVWVD